MKVTWLGHATVVIEVEGLRIVTDPLLTQRVAHLRRRVPLPEIGRVDAVLVSHVHMDHLHVPSLRRLADGARSIVPAGAEPLVSSLGFADVSPVRAGDRVDLQGRTGASVVVDVVEANHLVGRGPHSRVRAEPVGYVVRSGDRSVYFAGDTDLFDAMRELGPVDLALLPIWGWGPTLGERHLDPERAAIATQWIAPNQVVAIHWGTYSPIRPVPGSPAWLDDPVGAFGAALRELDLERRRVDVRPGGSLSL